MQTLAHFTAPAIADLTDTLDSVRELWAVLLAASKVVSLVDVLVA